MAIRGSSPDEKRPERKAKHSPPTTAEVKNVWSCTSIPLTPFHGGYRELSFQGLTALMGLGLLLVEVLIPHSDISYSLDILWTSDRTIAETST
jgi:hypothetical protein